jgi:hypothetical protein
LIRIIASLLFTMPPFLGGPPVRKLPGAAGAELDERKVTDYLMSETHKQGQHKCAFFKRFGFLPTNPGQLADAIKLHVVNHPVSSTRSDVFGTRYVVECSIRSPDGRDPCICTVWQQKTDGRLVFITAYPK